jgi:UDPglucose 6-dehydrogenase
MIGDTADRSEGANKHDVLGAVGCDSRIGSKYLRPGYGFGGPCFPRDNRALGAHIASVGIEPLIPLATDAANKAHTALQTEELLATAQQEFTFSQIGYKENCTVPIIEESQKLKIAASLARKGRRVTICDRANLVLAVQQQYGALFSYEVNDAGDAHAEISPQPHASAHGAKIFGGSDSYGVRRI